MGNSIPDDSYLFNLKGIPVAPFLNGSTGSGIQSNAPACDMTWIRRQIRLELSPGPQQRLDHRPTLRVGGRMVLRGCCGALDSPSKFLVCPLGEVSRQQRLLQSLNLFGKLPCLASLPLCFLRLQFDREASDAE